MHAAARGRATQCIQPWGGPRCSACSHWEHSNINMIHAAGNVVSGCRDMAKWGHVNIITVGSGPGRFLRERAMHCVPFTRQRPLWWLFGMDDIMSSSMQLLPGPLSCGCYLLLWIFVRQLEAEIGIRSSKGVDWHYFHVTCFKFELEWFFEGCIF